MTGPAGGDTGLMSDELSGLTIAILATDGVEQIELERPRDAVQAAGATTVLLSIDEGEIQAMHQDINKGDLIEVDRKVSGATVQEFDGLLLPGGTCNPDTLRADADAVNFVRNFVTSGKPVGVICHGPWTLVEADVVRGRTLTSFPSIRTDLRNAGAEVVDREVVVDDGLVSSRDPDDLDAFIAKVIEEFAEGRHSGNVT